MIDLKEAKRMLEEINRLNGLKRFSDKNKMMLRYYINELYSCDIEILKVLNVSLKEIELNYKAIFGSGLSVRPRELKRPFTYPFTSCL